MESGHRSIAALGRAARLVAEKGRIYVAGKRYAQVVVFTLQRSIADEVRSCFGGNVYKHRNGFNWVLAKYGPLRSLYDHLAEYPDKQEELKQKLLLAGREWDPVDEEELIRGRE